MEQTQHKARVQAQFAAAAEQYVTSATHAAGDDLEQLVAWAEGGPDRTALDVATGGGHTALALSPYFGRVVASDLTEPMLRSAEDFVRGQGVGNVEFRRADAEDLPFPDASFDLVSCRIAPHHFADVGRFVAEVARVLQPGGCFLLEDSIAPDDEAAAALLNRAEALRDSTHVRSLRAPEWRQVLADAGLTVEAERTFRKPHPFASWLDRAKTPVGARAAIEALFRDAPAPARAALAVAVDSAGQVISYTDEKILLKARKPDPVGGR